MALMRANSGRESAYVLDFPTVQRPRRGERDLLRADPIVAYDRRRFSTLKIFDKVIQLSKIRLLETFVEAWDRIMGDRVLGHYQDRRFAIIADLERALRPHDFGVDGIPVDSDSAEADHSDCATGK